MTSLSHQVRGHPLLVTLCGGLLASILTGRVDRWLNGFVSTEQKLRDRLVRKEPAHQLAGPYLGEKMLGRRLSRSERQRARVVFSIAYGLGWGTIYGAVRQRVPLASRAGGLPFAIPFFLFCDGMMAPLLGISPPLKRIPWQMNLKELINHAVWTVATEMVYRSAMGQGRGEGVGR